MATPVTSNPQFQDGVAAITEGIVSCLNNSVDYLYADDAIGETALHMEHDNPAGEALGSHTQATGRYKGPMSLQLLEADDLLPRPGYVLSFRGKYYVISGDIGPALKRNDVIRIKPPVTQAVNPVINSLLSTDGQVKAASVAGADGTVANTVVNTRSGATGAWSLSAWTSEYPSATVPAEITINSSSGLITCASADAGTYYLKATYTETLTDKPTRKGVGFLVLTCT